MVNYRVTNEEEFNSKVSNVDTSMLKGLTADGVAKGPLTYEDAEGNEVDLGTGEHHAASYEGELGFILTLSKLSKEDTEAIREAVHEDADSERVIKFVTGDELTEEVCELIHNGDLQGLHYNDEGEIIAVDICQEEHKALK